MEGESRPERITRSVVLDHGGPLIFEEAPGPSERRDEAPQHGFCLEVGFCDNRDCRWAHVRALDLEQANGIDLDDEDHASRIGRSVVRASLNLDTWTLEYVAATDGLPRNRDLEPRFEALLEREGPALRAILEKRWRHGHGVGKDDWKRKDWSWWEPGEMVSWSEIHGDDPHLLFPIGGVEVWADDMYCVTPKCSCREAAVTFRRVADLPREPYAELRVDLRGWTAAPAAGGRPLSPREREAWNVWNDAYPDLRREMNRRRPIMLRHGKVILRLARAVAPRRAEPEAKPRIPRNAPCPCGSGRKYKKCCLGK